MTANAGYHAYATGDVLTAAQVQYNLQNQTVMYFATTTARDTALSTAKVEGMVSYTPATGLMYYSGTAWIAVGGGGATVPTSYGFTAGKNIIINGLMDFWQRGTSFSSGYTADRWYGNFDSGSGTFARETSVVPTGQQYALKVTASGVAQPYFQQAIETAQAIEFAGQTVVLSAQMGASLSVPVTMYVAYSTNVDNPNTGSWTNITPTTGGTMTPSSTTYVTGTGVYAIPSTAKSLRVRIEPTSVIIASTVLYLGSVQLEAGTTATQFSRSSGTIQGELAACQRYFVKSYNQADAPGTATSTGGKSVRVNASSVSNVTFGVQYPVSMRITPTVTYYSGQGTSGTFSTDYAGSNSTGSVNVNNSGSTGWTGENSGTATGLMMFHYTGDAEL